MMIEAQVRRVNSLTGPNLSGYFDNLRSQNISGLVMEPIWRSEFKRRITRFDKIQKSFGSVYGTVISRDVIINADAFLTVAMSNIPETPSIALLDNGSLEFEWENNDQFLSVVVTNQRSNYVVCYGSDSSDEYVEELSGDRRYINAKLKVLFKDA